MTNGSLTSLIFAVFCASERVSATCDENGCLSAVPGACGGRCFAELVESVNTLDGSVKELEALCATECISVWANTSTVECLMEQDTLAASETVKLIRTLQERVCPSTCFTSAIDLEDDHGCFEKGCLPRCRSVLDGLTKDCRSAVVASPNRSISSTATLIFDKCGLDYDVIEADENEGVPILPSNGNGADVGQIIKLP